MKKIDIINKIANNEELPEEIYYRGDVGELTKEKDFVNYIITDKNDKYNLYWLVDHDLQGLNDEVKVKVKRK